MSSTLSQEQLLSLYQDAPCGFLITTLEGAIFGANRTFLTWVGYEEEDLVGLNVRDVLSAASKLFYDTHYAALLQAGRVIGVSMDLARRGAPPLPVLVTSLVKFSAGSDMTLVHSTFFDASERRHAERNLVVAKRRADALADVVHSSPHAIFTVGYDLDVRTWNTAAEALLHASPALAAASELSSYLPEQAIDSLVRCLELDLAIEEQVTLSPGIVCQMSAYPMKDGLAVHLVDITEQKLMQDELEQAHDRFNLATMATTDGIWDWNCETGIVYLSGRAQSMAGYATEATELPVRQVLRRFHAKDLARFRKDSRKADRWEERFETEWRIRHLDGTWRWIQSRGLILFDKSHRARRVVGSLTDVTDRKTEDPLTKLHTRLSLLDQLDSRLSSDTHFEHPCALLFVNVDAFKKVTDGLGLAAGDTLISTLAKRLKTSVSARKQSFAARLRSDEFVVVLGEVSNAEEACTFAELLQRQLQQPMLIAGQQISVSASIGVALNRPFAGSAEDLLRNADLAMYRAKATGKGKSVVFTQEMHQAAHKRLILEADLQQAVWDNKLQLFYQPKLDLMTGATVGYEALGRWKHPVHGMVSPDIFIAIAEDSNLIRDIGRWTIEESMRQLAEWRSLEVVAPETSVSINLSPKQFDDDSLIDIVKTNLCRYGLPPSCIHFEVTEGVLISDVDSALDVLNRLKRIGVGLELDDFGKGYSSLSYLHRYPFDSLKIDRSFVSGLDRQEDSQTIVQTIIALGHALGLIVIAEGVETKDQKDLLRDLGCELGQGYLFSKPVPPDSIRHNSKLRQPE